MKVSKIVVTVEEATDIILNSIIQLKGERVSILDATKRVLFEDIISSINIPLLDNSAMDGYAIIAADTIGSNRERPVKLPVLGEVQAGGDHQGIRISSGSVIRIMTGAPIPKSADAVVQFEDTCEEDGIVSIYREVKKGENIRLAGEDIRKGGLILQSGHLLRSADIGILASLNYQEVMLYRRPEVAIISTGDEIVDIGEVLHPGQIRNSNSYTLYSEIKRYNTIPHYLGIARDDIDETKEKLNQAFKYDVIITTGGVSMGRYDFVKDVMIDLGVDIKFESIRMKPGKPCIFGIKGHKLFFGLPGNPVSTMISFYQFVRPAILKLMGAERINIPTVNAILEEGIRKKPDRVNFIRGHFTINDGELYVKTTGSQGSGILSSMSRANCIILLPIGIEGVHAGERVSIQLIHHEEIE
ncbi:MAG: molybdopterin molybdotransferase MoeA [Spirochaetota bacterium]|nr:molybdopterin molybdotransferase MoeA [Spirochaetota bacterium]